MLTAGHCLRRAESFGLKNARTNKPASSARLRDIADNYRRLAENTRLQQALHAMETARLHKTQKLPRRKKQAEMAKNSIDHFLFQAKYKMIELDCWEARANYK